METVMKILILFCMVSASRGEFVFPHECNDWLRNCQPILHPETGSVLGILFESPAALLTHGSFSIDCSSNMNTAVDQCVETDNGICSIPFSAASIRTVRNYLCANSAEFESASGCLNNDSFINKWKQCMDMQVGQYCSPVVCLQDKLSDVSTEVCSQNAKSQMTQLLGLMVQAFGSGAVATC